jgi:hypothetical protein
VVPRISAAALSAEVLTAEVLAAEVFPVGVLLPAGAATRAVRTMDPAAPLMTAALIALRHPFVRLARRMGAHAADG